MNDIRAEVNGLFRGVAPNVPSDNLRYSLFDLFASRIEGTTNIGGLLSALLRHSPIAQIILGVANLAKIVPTANTLAPTGIEQLIKSGSEIAARYGHHEITEMHILISVLEFHSSDVEAALKPFSKDYRRRHPKGTRRQQMLVEFSPRLAARG